MTNSPPGKHIISCCEKPYVNEDGFCSDPARVPVLMIAQLSYATFQNCITLFNSICKKEKKNHPPLANLAKRIYNNHPGM